MQIEYTSPMTWFYLSLLSVFTLAAAELTQQKLLNTKDAVSERTSAVLTFFLEGLFVLPFILLTPLRSEFLDIFKPEVRYNVIAVTIIGAFAMVFYLRSFKVKNISISTIFVSASTLVSTSLGILLFGESVYFLKLIGILLILIAIISLNIKNATLEKNHFYGLLAGLCFGINYSLDKGALLHVNPLIYLFWVFILVAIAGFILGPKDVITSVKGKRISFLKPILFSGLGYVVYNLCTFYAYTYGGEVGRIDAINNSQVFLIILFEYIVLKHTTDMKRKLITALVAYIGIVILGLF